MGEHDIAFPELQASGIKMVIIQRRGAQLPLLFLLPGPGVSCQNDSCVPIGGNSPGFKTAEPQRIAFMLTKVEELAWSELAIFAMDPGKWWSLLVQRLWPLRTLREAQQKGKELPGNPEFEARLQRVGLLAQGFPGLLAGLS